MSIFKKLINKLNERRMRKLHRRCQMMNSEIICAIADEVRKAEAKAKVSLPAFVEVQNRYDALGIKTHKDVIRAYKWFYEQGLVSGISL